MASTTLLEIRKQEKVSLRELGEAVDRTKGHLSRIERGEVRPSPDLADRIAVFFKNVALRDELLFPKAIADGAKKPARSARPQEAR